MKIDRRRNYFMVLDVETANTIGQPLVYDIGFAIMDTQGRIYRQYSYVVQEIFFDEKKIFHNSKMMGSAYYAKKLPQYYKGIFETKDWICKPLRYIEAVVRNECERWNVKAICAYNASFDTKALRNTIRYVTKSENAEFLPDIEIYDIWNMACQTIGQKVDYSKFCFENGFYSEAKNCQTSAQIMWRYLTKELEFEEAHTGLADVFIECAIMAESLKYHKKINRNIEAMPWKKVQPIFKKVYIGD